MTPEDPIDAGTFPGLNLSIADLAASIPANPPTIAAAGLKYLVRLILAKNSPLRIAFL